MNADVPLDTPTLHDQHGRWPQADSVEDFRRNLSAVHARIAAACQRVGRDPASVRLLPVSKTKTEASIRLAYAAGCRLLGENKAQEAHRKWGAMADLSDLRWSAIGHLQTNKAKLVARFAIEFHALDSLRVAEALERRLQAEGRGFRQKPSACAGASYCCASCVTGCARAHRGGSCWMNCRWACPATTKSPSRKAQPFST